MLWWDDEETAAWAGELIDIVDDEQWGKAAKMATAMLPERKSDIDKAVLYAVRGVARAELGEHDSAVADFTRALEFECAGERGVAKDRDTHSERGFSYFVKGEYDTAIADFTRAIELDDSFSGPYFHRAASRFEKGEHDLAVADFTRALEIDKLPEAYCGRGRAYHEQGKNDLAIADFTRAIELDDEDDEPYFHRATVRVAMKEFKLAVADLDKALELNDEESKIYALRAHCYGKLQQYENFTADFKKAAQLNPDFPVPPKEGREEAAAEDDGDEFIDKAMDLEEQEKWGEVVSLATAELPKAESESETRDPGMVYYIRGRAYYEQGDHKLAIADLTRALALNPDIEIDCLFFRGMAHFEEGDYDAAIADLDGEVFSDIDATYTRGVAYHEKGEHDRAIADLTRCIENEDEPPVAEAHFHRGVSYLYKEDFARGLADLDRAIELAPDNTVIYLMRAAAYEERGEFQKAVADYKSVLRLDPRNEDAREGLHSMLESAQKRGMKIITPDGEPFDLSVIKDAEAMGPTDDGGESFAHELRQLQDEGEWDEVVKMASAALPVTKSDTSLSVLHYYRGDAFVKKGDAEAAIADLTRALELDPENSADAFASRGLAYFKQGDYDSAIADLSREEIADDIGAVYLRGCAYHETEQHDLAIADFNKVIETESDFPGAHYRRGAAYTEKGDYARAVADLSKALELSPDNVMAYTLRGYALSMQGKHRIGLADLNQALRLDPDNKEAREVRRLIRQRAKGRM